MARKLPRRGAGGRFMKGGGKRRRSSSRRTKSNPPRRHRRRRTTRRNPPVSLRPKNIGRELLQGVKDAGFIIGGKASARALPTLLKLPQAGLVGLGVQLGTAFATGLAVHKFVGRDAGRFWLAGGLTAPLETWIVAKNVPFLAPALSPGTAAVQVGAYVAPGLSAYYLPAARRAPVQMEGRGMGAYVSPAGRYDLGSDY